MMHTLESLGRFRQFFEERFSVGHSLRDRLGGEVKQGAVRRLGGFCVDELIDRGDLESLCVSLVTGGVEEVTEHENEL